MTEITKYNHHARGDTHKMWNLDWVLPELRKAVHYAYDCTRKNRKTSIPYDGPNDIVSSVGAGSPPPKEQLTQELLDYHEERGRSALDVILLITFQLGFSQGERNLENRNGPTARLTDLMAMITEDDGKALAIVKALWHAPYGPDDRDTLIALKNAAGQLLGKTPDDHEKDEYAYVGWDFTKKCLILSKDGD
ncbi:MAG: hypothetical protein KOO63_09345 [Bacteroidales bacterium]|nr:hypothetical protein [Candidatus Latescibacterota bacterium]